MNILVFYRGEPWDWTKEIAPNFSYVRRSDGKWAFKHSAFDVEELLDEFVPNEIRLKALLLS